MVQAQTAQVEGLRGVLIYSRSILYLKIVSIGVFAYGMNLESFS